MILKELRGKKANTQRWEALKKLNWDKDQEIIKAIFEITNPLFFSSRTSNEIIEAVQKDINYEKLFKEHTHNEKR